MTHQIDVELQAGSVLLSSVGPEDIPSLRTLWDRLSEQTSRASLDSVDARDVLLPRGDRDLLLRVYNPLGAPSCKPAVLMVHSGAFVAGSIESIHAESLYLASALSAVVVSVAYRLAPENPYPAAVDDCDDALSWIIENSDELGVNTDCIALHGTSAGAALAVATTLRRLDKGSSPVSTLYLNAPQLDDRLFSESMNEFTDTPCYTRRSAEISWDSYLGAHRRGTDEIPIHAAPGRATVEELRGFPPTYIALMQFDPLRDEGIAFAQRLLSAGTPVELHVFPQTFHGSSVIVHAEVSQREADEAVVVLRKRLRASMW